MSEAKSSWYSRLFGAWKGLPVWVRTGLWALILAVAGNAIWSAINDQMNARPDAVEKTIAVIMSEGDETFTIPAEFKRGFDNARQDEQKLVATDGTPIRFETVADDSTVEGATVTATRWVNDPNCIMIIGNSNSELTGATLNVIRSASPEDRPVFIMPIATANNLTKVAQASDYHALLRMVPANEKQADVIRDFVTRDGSSKRVVILVDEQNADYSNDLSTGIASKIQGVGGRVALQANYGNSSRLRPHVDLLLDRANEIDYIIFVGVSTNGFLLVDELELYGIESPLIFTDGSTVENLIRRAGDLPNKSYFLSAAATPADSNIEPTYEPIGRDTYRIVADLIKNASAISKQQFRTDVEAYKEKLNLSGGEAGNYKFSDIGENTFATFRIYLNESGKLIEESLFRSTAEEQP